MKKDKDEKIVRVMKKLRETYVGEQEVTKINNKYINILEGEGREELEKR